MRCPWVEYSGIWIGGVNMGDFLNSFVVDSQNFWTAVAFVVAYRALLGWRYNQWMDSLGKTKEGYTAFLVAGGVLLGLMGVAVISWKAAVLCSSLYVVDGLFMIFGDVGRSLKNKKKSTRRKPFPYAAGKLIDKALMSLGVAQGELKLLVKINELEVVQRAALVLHEVDMAVTNLQEAKGIEGE